MSPYTKQAIKNSFLKLLNERPLSQVTVKAIVEDCGINRNTFYYHFADIASLATEIITDRADSIIQEYANPESEKYERMVEEIRKELNFTSLRFNRLDDMLDSIDIDKCKLCTYCWDGKE